MIGWLSEVGKWQRRWLGCWSCMHVIQNGEYYNQNFTTRFREGRILMRIGIKIHSRISCFPSQISSVHYLTVKYSTVANRHLLRIPNPFQGFLSDGIRNHISTTNFALTVTSNLTSSGSNCSSSVVVRWPLIPFP